MVVESYLGGHPAWESCSLWSDFLTSVWFRHCRLLSGNEKVGRRMDDRFTHHALPLPAGMLIIFLLLMLMWLALYFQIWSPLFSETHSFQTWHFLLHGTYSVQYVFHLFAFLFICFSLENKLQDSRNSGLFVSSWIWSTKNFQNSLVNELYLFSWHKGNQWIVWWMTGGHTDWLKYLIHGIREFNSWVKLES